MKICVDAGGSKVSFALIDDSYNLRHTAKYKVSALPQGEHGLLAALSQFVAGLADDTWLRKIKYLIVGAAGPVENNCVRFTNSDWVIECDHLTQEFSKLTRSPLRAALLNDFEALAYGLALLDESDTVVLHAGQPKGATRIVCGPGTGLGLGGLRALDSSKFDVIALSTEGGHQTFAAETPLDREIWDYFGEPLVSYEHVLSGRGLQTLYRFFSQEAHAQEREAPSPVEIVKQYAGQNPAAKRTLETFASILGAFCGNMVLALGARRGVYLWGGILKEFPREVLRSNMLGRMHRRPEGSFVADAPVFHIVSDHVALKGCALFADKFLTA